MKKFNNRIEIKISQELLAYLKSDLKQVKKAAKHRTLTQLIRYFIINGLNDIYGEKWIEYAKTESIPEYEEYIKLQSGRDMDNFKKQQEWIKNYMEKRKKGIQDFSQLDLFDKE